ncbi:hypothetical protein AC1031_018707 [Aphanomyces cochlioides]|nr:hypothetical protein AC1031_018707 [Aphanomyces cochlioides]
MERRRSSRLSRALEDVSDLEAAALPGRLSTETNDEHVVSFDDVSISMSPSLPTSASRRPRMSPLRKDSLLREAASTKSLGRMASADSVASSIGSLSKSESEFDVAIILKPLRGDEIAAGDDNSRRNTGPLGRHDKSFYKKYPHQAKLELLRRLHRAGLETKAIRSLDAKQTLVQVKAPQAVLEYGAEKIKLKKQRRGDFLWVDYSHAIRETLVDYDAATDAVRFLDKEKQMIVHRLIVVEAALDEHSDLIVIVEQMLPLHKANLDLLRRSWVCYWRRPVASRWTHGLRCLFRIVWHGLDQPLDDVAQYFGEKVAFYFAWVQMYTKWLLLPTLAGIWLFVLQVQSQSLDQPLAPVYALFMAVWASVFLVAWKRRANSLAYRWGVLGYEDDDEDIRADYRDATSFLPRGCTRWLKYAVTFVIVVVFMAAILGVMYLAFTTRDRLQQESLAVQSNLTAQWHHLTLANLASIRDGLSIGFWFYLLIMPMLYGLCIPVFDMAFSSIATKLTKWENHKTESAYQSALILKVFPFRCVHVFATLYYYAFTAGDNLLQVAIQLATFMLSGQMWNNVVKTGIPLFRQRYQLRQRRLATAKLLKESPIFTVDSKGLVLNKGNDSTVSAVAHNQCIRLEQASSILWEECQLDKYDTFDDYTEMLIQFGYVSFFSIAFPLAPLLALINNVVSLRADAFKLCHTMQRPRALKASGIGIWFPVLQTMSVIAVITNCLHVAFTTTQIEHYLPGISPADKVWVVFCAEHATLFVQICIAYVVPSMAKDLRVKVRAEKTFAKQASANAAIAKQFPLDQDEVALHAEKAV